METLTEVKSFRYHQASFDWKCEVSICEMSFTLNHYERVPITTTEHTRIEACTHTRVTLVNSPMKKKRVLRSFAAIFNIVTMFL